MQEYAQTMDYTNLDNYEKANSKLNEVLSKYFQDIGLKDQPIALANFAFLVIWNEDALNSVFKKIDERVQL